MADALSMISADGRHTITVGTSDENGGGRLVVSGPDVLTGQFGLDMDLDTTLQVGRALLRVYEARRAAG